MTQIYPIHFLLSPSLVKKGPDIQKKEGELTQEGKGIFKGAFNLDLKLLYKLH